jgi:hypothetical protein
MNVFYLELVISSIFLLSALFPSHGGDFNRESSYASFFWGGVVLGFELRASRKAFNYLSHIPSPAKGVGKDFWGKIAS